MLSTSRRLMPCWMTEWFSRVIRDGGLGHSTTTLATVITASPASTHRSLLPGMANPPWSCLPQHQIHRPAPPHVRPRTAQVVEQVSVGAAGVFQGVGENRETREVPGLVD